MAIDFSKLHAIGKEPTTAVRHTESKPSAGQWNRPSVHRCGDSWDEKLSRIIAEHFPGEEYGGEYGAKEHEPI